MGKIKQNITLTILLALLFTGCGNTEQQGAGQQGEQLQKYTAQYDTLTNVLEPYSTQMYLTTDAFYYIQEEEDRTILFCREMTQPEENLSRLLIFESNQKLDCFTMTEAGELILVVTEYALSEEGTLDYSMPSEDWLRKYSGDGSLLWEQALPKEMGESVLLHADSRGQIYFLTHDDMIHIYDRTGVKQNQVSVSDVYSMASTPEGLIFLANNAETREFTPDTGQVQSKSELDGYSIYHTGRELGVLDSTCLYTYHPEQDITLVKCIDLLEYYVDVSCVTRVALDEEGRIAILCRDGIKSRDVELILLSPQGVYGVDTGEDTQEESVESHPEIILQLAALETDNYASTIIDFNRASDNASVELMKLPGEEEMTTRIAASLLSENAPDMIQIKSGPMSDDYHKYADNGYLLDLTPYLESSQVISQEDFADWVIEDFTVDGKIYALPTMMEFATILCPTEYMEGRTNWTIEEFLEFVEKYPDALVGEHTVSDHVQLKQVYLQQILMCGMEVFVDREEGIAHLDEERFRNVLQRIHELEMTEVTETLEERVDAGELVVTGYEPIKSNRSFADAEWRLSQGKGVTLMGYPTPEAIPGEPGAHNISYYNILGITATCQHPDEAWKFIERNLVKAITGEVSAFPTGKAALEKKLQEETAADYHMGESEENMWRQIYGNRKSVGVITEEQVEKVRCGLENSFWFARDVDDALNIILEEAEPYFQGQKSLDDTVKILQSRMQIYLDERY